MLLYSLSQKKTMKQMQQQDADSPSSYRSLIARSAAQAKDLYWFKLFFYIPRKVY